MAGVVKVAGLTVSRGGKRVIHDVSFEVPSGTITALLGANGAGKSSIVMAMSGVLPVESGTVSLSELKLTGLAADRVRRRGVALVPEGHRVLGNLNVEENLTVASLKPREVTHDLKRVYGIFPELLERRG